MSIKTSTERSEGINNWVPIYPLSASLSSCRSRQLKSDRIWQPRLLVDRCIGVDQLLRVGWDRGGTIRGSFQSFAINDRLEWSSNSFWFRLIWVAVEPLWPKVIGSIKRDNQQSYGIPLSTIAEERHLIAMPYLARDYWVPNKLLQLRPAQSQSSVPPNKT